MSVAEALTLMLGFGTFTVSLLGFVVVLIKSVKKDKK
ncbi:putative holin-like toxin [Listeria weihenstephanensis]|uniref:Putative holin-like toxin n=1 Tax=Listeria weihenstephanensis TaxID=1006155 RepID=A0A841Z178_9LIST|nr:putative holin-like toxin [Listeria weihenstephanensis]MBC1499094.1 putative holin-like toxin [Listeria weihenstephanensis]